MAYLYCDFEFIYKFEYLYQQLKIKMGQPQ